MDIGIGRFKVSKSVGRGDKVPLTNFTNTLRNFFVFEHKTAQVNIFYLLLESMEESCTGLLLPEFYP